MKKDFFDDSFEGYLKRNADQLRMRPSENVWKNIEKNRNRQRRRITIGSAVFFLTASLFSYFSLNNGSLVSLKPVAEQPTGNRTKSATRPAQNNNAEQNFIENRETLATATPVIKKSRFPKTGSPLHVASLFGETPSQTSVAGEEPTAFTTNPVDEYEPFNTQPPAPVSPEADRAAVSEEHPLSIESVVNSYKPKARKKKAEFQVFFTPTISYRKLSENKSYLRSAPQGNTPASISALYDVNNVVTHKPDLGLELGFAVKYSVAKAVKIKTGLQFNMNRYDIKVFSNQPEIATIALNTSSGGVNSLNTVTRYRNFSGAQPDWVQNTYYQISTPLGIEIKLRGDDQKHFGIATNIQPTYIIGDRAYLISTDYKNYSQVPWLIRNWNVNTSAEAFVAYSTGKLKWQVGPQIRYQLLSSFRSEYPVKENLFDFGFKVGVALNNR